MPSQTIQNIAIAGASGNVGRIVVDALIEAKYNVTVLTRAGSSSTLSFHSALTVKSVDYTSKESLVTALKGQQGLLSLLNGPPTELQPDLVDAALEAGVTRFIPSEFGSDTLDARIAAIPLFGGKIKTLQHLKHKAAEIPSFSYTALITGPFIDYCLENPLIADPKHRTALIVDGGGNAFSSTPIPEVAKAIVGVFNNLEGTKNQVIYIESLRVSQNQIIKIGQKLTGTKWTLEHATSKDLEAAAWEELRQKEPNPEKFVFPFLRSTVLGGGPGAIFGDKVRNELVGLERLPDSEVEDQVKRLL